MIIDRFSLASIILNYIDNREKMPNLKFVSTTLLYRNWESHNYTFSFQKIETFRKALKEKLTYLFSELNIFFSVNGDNLKASRITFIGAIHNLNKGWLMRIFNP